MKPVPRHRLLVTGLVATALAAAGCGSSTSPTSPTLTQDSADDAAIQSVLALGAVGGSLSAATSSAGGVAQARPLARPAAAQWDTAFTWGTVAFAASREFFDAQGNLLPGFDSTAVRMVWTARASGAIETARDTALVGHADSLDVRGIQKTQDTLLVNGAGRDTILNKFLSFDGTQTRYSYWRSALALQGITGLKSAPPGSWPIAGTVAFDGLAARLRSYSALDIASEATVHVVITFNGSNPPSIVVNGTWHYLWYPATGQIVRA